MKTAIVFLSNTPQDGTLNFAIDLALNSNFDVFLVIDNNEKYYGKSFKGVNIIQVPDDVCIEHGYYNSNISKNDTHIKKNPIALDKFLYSFCETYISYDFVWVFEDDVFIPSIQTLEDLQFKYKEYDLVVPNNFEKKDDIMDWHWRKVIDKHEKPLFYSMVCGMGVSRNLLNSIKRYVIWNNTLFYCEVMFNTVAYHNRLKIKSVLELKSIVWMGEWGIDEFLLLPNNVFHPRKDIDNHENLRKQIQDARDSNYLPKNKLPKFIKDAL